MLTVYGAEVNNLIAEVWFLNFLPFPPPTKKGFVGGGGMVSENERDKWNKMSTVTKTR